MAEKEKWYNNGWIVGLGIIFLTPICNFIIELISGFPFKEAFQNTKSFISSIINFELKLWWVAALWISRAIVLSLWELLNKNEDEVIPQQDFLQYKTDRLKNWRWSWDYKLDSYTKQYKIVNLKAYCPYCDTSLLFITGYLNTQAKCPRCDRHYSEYEVEDENAIRTLIYDNVQKNRYQRVIQSN